MSDLPDLLDQVVIPVFKEKRERVDLMAATDKEV